MHMFDVRRYVTLVGTRDVPNDIMDLQLRLGGTFCDAGYTGRSGRAVGSDDNFYHGALLSPNYWRVGFDNFIAEKRFCREQHNPNAGLYHLAETGFKKRAYFLAIGARGTGRNLTPTGTSLHTRNAMQVLGASLTVKSRLLVCHARPINTTKVDGGTNTAVQLARHFGIDVVNTYTDEGMRRALAFLEKNEKRNYAEIFRRVTGIAGKIHEHRLQ